MTNNPETYLKIVEELGYDPMAMESPHNHTIRIPGCVRCDLGADEAERTQRPKKKPKKASPTSR